MKTLTLEFESDDTRELFRRLAKAVPGVTVADMHSDIPDSHEIHYDSEGAFNEALNIQWARK